jgi:predicted RNase H-like HicB family nuclease
VEVMTMRKSNVEVGGAANRSRDGKYHARYEIDPDGVWLASVVEIPQVHTYGSTLGKAREYLIDALALWLDVSIENLRPEIVHGPALLPTQVQLVVDEARSARVIAETTAKFSNELLTQAAFALVNEAHLSRRDAGDLLDLSHQRVQQLVAGQASLTTSFATTPSSAREIAERLKDFLPGGSKEDLGVLIGSVAVGLALLWAASSD